MAREITTGVDKLMSLLALKKTVSVAEAAKQLGVPKIVVEEWSDYLNQRGIIDIEYKLATPYLVRKEITRGDILKSKKEFEGKREWFIRKVESALSTIEKETVSLQEMKQHFSALSQELGEEVSRVEKDVAALEKYEKLKNDLDRQLIAQQEGFKRMISEIDSSIASKARDIGSFSAEINKEKLKIEAEAHSLEVMRENEEKLRKRLEGIRNVVNVMEQALRGQESGVEVELKRLAELKELSERVSESIKKKKSEIEPLARQAREANEKLLKMQQSILSKVLVEKRRLQGVRKKAVSAKSKLGLFFATQNKMLDRMNRINREIESLKLELHSLLKEASLMGKGSQKPFDFERKFKQVEHKRGFLEKEIIKLGKLIKGRR